MTDVMTRKILTMAGAFHVASDVDRLYVQRSEKGRRLTSIEDVYEIKTVGTAEHLESTAGKHRRLILVRKHEKEKLCRLGREFLKRRQEVQNCSKAKESTRKKHAKRWINKETHGFLQSQLQRSNIIDIPKTNKRLSLRLTSHIEGYLIAIQEQELRTKETQRRRQKDTE